MLRFVRLLPVLVCVSLLAANWPQFRGPGGSGVSTETGLPTTWSDEENIVWKVKLPTYGASSPITWGEKIFIAGYSGYGAGDGGKQGDLKRHVTCLNRADGKVLWDSTVESTPNDKSYGGFVRLHGYASATPVTDGKAVYAYFGKTGAVAFDMQGKQLWQTDCGSGTHGFGSGASPVLYKNLLIVNACVESGTLIALDKKSGEQVWKSGKIKAAWSTPVLVDVGGGRQELVVSTRGTLIGYDPASGEELWTCSGIQNYVCPSPIAHKGVVYAIGGRGRKGLAVKAGGRGDVTETHRLWQLDRGSNVSSPVLYDGHLYWAHEGQGILYCADAETGKVVYEQRLDPKPGRIYASPVAVDGKLYYASRERGVFVVAAKPAFELLSHNKIESDKSIFNGSPVVSNGRLLLRSNEYLYCVGSK
ncbi:MAG: PQQ-binding-like beta-propeller repeat protein [Planctomycetes bacterium]|nr:PQQ-binding-like beta-propeller repeat protein [Planctomycetota bacterium]